MEKVFNLTFGFLFIISLSFMVMHGWSFWNDWNISQNSLMITSTLMYDCVVAYTFTVLFSIMFCVSTFFLFYSKISKMFNKLQEENKNG